MGKCLHCHEPVSETARFCENCGTAVEAGESLAASVAARIRELMAAGQKIEAIRLLREATGIGLAEAKELVESDTFEAAIDPPAGAGPDLDAELLELLRSGRKIEAIKRHREQTRQGLKESKDYVEALAGRQGVTSRQSGCASVILAAMLAVVILVAVARADDPAVRTRDGWFVHPITSTFQAAPTEIQVLTPDRMEPNRRYPVLYVLPVEANNEHRYGDGLSEAKRCDLHNRHSVICVAPTFALLPWYADHPTDPAIRQESYVVKEVVPLVERLYPARTDRQSRWLVGFSKSGWGAWSLAVRHPDLFGRAAAWDAPLDMPRFDQYGAGPIFGTQAHFETYRVLPALKKLEKQPAPRLVLTGYDNFRSHHQTAHSLLDEAKIVHVYRDGPERKHVWDSGWLEEAVELLAKSDPEK